MKVYLQLLALTLLAWMLPAKAQIIPDGTVGSIVTPNGVSSDIINGGAVRGNNLFHSFSEFNINTGRGVYFTNPTNITNIFTRITGTNSTHINGTLGVLGNANLVFMNPNGIIFGTSALLDLKGSFLGTTASSIKFADGSEFTNLNQTTTIPLLSVSVPVGLGFGSGQGEIKVQGTGHNVSASNYFPSQGAGRSESGLRVESGKTLALVGGNIALEGGILSVEQGRIELGSVKNGEVTLNLDSGNFSLGYSGVKSFQNITLSQLALVDASGKGGGTIDVRGANVTLLDSSLLLNQNQGLSPSDNITVTAKESLILRGVANGKSTGSGLQSETLGLGHAANIEVFTPQLVLQQGGRIYTTTFTSADSGNITINASDSIKLFEFFPQAQVSSIISALTYASGKAGNITINTSKLTSLNGSIIGSVTLGSGPAGNITVNASDIGLIGTSDLLQPSGITTGTVSTGQAGNVIINTSKLTVTDGATVDSSTIASGAAGSVFIDAKDSVEVSGQVPFSRNPSLISSSAKIVDESLIEAFRLPPIPTGASGDVFIKTPRLNIRDGGLVSVRNQGSDNAGIVNINANLINLNSRGGITATTNNGFGGEIKLQAQNLQMSDNSYITATAGGVATGGNIIIDADTIVQLANSNITADAFQGKGGEITINTQGIFNLPDSYIKASSDLGIDGVVNITTPDIKQDWSLTQQSSEFVNAEQVITNSCIARRNDLQGSFVVTGNGGLPANPNEDLTLPYSLISVRAISNLATQPPYQPNSKTDVAWTRGDEIKEATQLIKANDGRLLLTGYPNPKIINIQNLTCSSD